jgi:nitronate monooxygenase
MTILTRLGVSLPIVQAPMAGVSTPEMAAAVSNAGGLGSIAVGATDADGARAMMAATRAATDRAFNVNLFVHAPARADPEREAAWLRALAPAFRDFGAEPPGALREIYRSFAAAGDAAGGGQLSLRPAVRRPHPCAEGGGMPAAGDGDQPVRG